MAKTLAGTNAKLRFINCRTCGFIFLFLGLTVAGSTVGYPASPRSYRPHAYADVAGDNDTLLLRKAADEIRQGRYGEVHSMLIFKNDKMLFEAYFPGHQYKWDAPNYHGEWTNWDQSALHGVRSVSKVLLPFLSGLLLIKDLLKVWISLF